MVVYREDGTFVRSIGARGAGNGQFIYPFGVPVGAGGRIVVADKGNKRLQVLNADGGHLMTIGCTGTGAGQFVNPISVAVRGRPRGAAPPHQRVARTGPPAGQDTEQGAKPLHHDIVYDGSGKAPVRLLHRNTILTTRTSRRP